MLEGHCWTKAASYDEALISVIKFCSLQMLEGHCWTKAASPDEALISVFKFWSLQNAGRQLLDYS